MRKSAWKQPLPPISSSEKTIGKHSLRESSWPSLTRPPQQQSSAPSQQQQHQQQQQLEQQPPPTTSGLSKARQRSMLSQLSLPSAPTRSQSDNNSWCKANSNDNNNIDRIHHLNRNGIKNNHVHHRDENNCKIDKKKHQSLSLHEQQQRYRALNRAIVVAKSSSEILFVLEQSAKLSEVGAGKTLDTVNFSTALHRLARHAMATTTSTTVSNKNAPKQQSSPESQVRSDPRTALLLASIAECMVDPTIEFQAQHLANIAWALAKLQLAPPFSDVPSALDRNQSHKLLATTAASVRQKVMEVAAERATSTLSHSSSNVAHHWMSALTQLAGYTLDVTGETILRRVTDAGTVTTQRATSRGQQSFQMQNWSNLLWAWATAGRANEQVFGVVTRYMIRQQSQMLRRQELQNGLSGRTNPATNDPSSLPTKEQDTLQPQTWANAVWAMATAQCGGRHDELLVYFARLLEEYPDFISNFNSQNLSNTLWGIATLLLNKKRGLASAGSFGGLPSTPTEESSSAEHEHRAALMILRIVFQTLVQCCAHAFSTQELSNSIWAAATLGFGLTTQNTEEQQRLYNYVVLKSDQPTLDAKLMVEVVNVVVQASLPQLLQFSAQGLNNLAWALARLAGDDSNQNVLKFSTELMRTNVRALLEGIGWQLADPRRAVKSQDVGTTLWAMATLEFYDRDVYRGIARRLSPDKAHLYKPQELSNTVWAFATAEAEVEDIDAFDTTLISTLEHPRMPRDPVTICFAIAAKELIRRPYQFEPQAVTNMLWAFSKIGIRHPILFKSVAQHLAGSEDGSITARGLDEFLLNHLSRLAWAYARQAQLAQSTSDRFEVEENENESNTSEEKEDGDDDGDADDESVDDTAEDQYYEQEEDNESVADQFEFEELQINTTTECNDDDIWELPPQSSSSESEESTDSDRDDTDNDGDNEVVDDAATVEAGSAANDISIGLDDIFGDPGLDAPIDTRSIRNEDVLLDGEIEMNINELNDRDIYRPIYDQLEIQLQPEFAAAEQVNASLASLPTLSWKKYTERTNIPVTQLRAVYEQLGVEQFGGGGMMHWVKDTEKDRVTTNEKVIRHRCCYYSDTNCPFVIRTTTSQGIANIEIGNRPHQHLIRKPSKRTQRRPGLPKLIQAILIPDKSYLKKPPKEIIADAVSRWGPIPLELRKQILGKFTRLKSHFVSGGTNAATWGKVVESFEVYKKENIGEMGEHDVFVVGMKVEEHTSRGNWMVAILSTEDLLLNAYRQTFFGHPIFFGADTAYRVMHEGWGLYPVITVTLENVAKTIAYAVLSAERTDVHKFIFENIKVELERVVKARARTRAEFW